MPELLDALLGLPHQDWAELNRPDRPARKHSSRNARHKRH
jgi:hypothetical protein